MMIKDGEYISVVGKDVTHYHAKSVNPYWSDSLSYKTSVGNHIFYTQSSTSPYHGPRDLFVNIETSLFMWRICA